MSRLLLLALLLLPLGSMADAVYRTIDAQGNVVFTDTPPTDATPADRIEIRPTNTVRPPETLSRPAPVETPEEESEVVTYKVEITEPANETSFPRGPGNFSVKAAVSPELSEMESLQLFIDGTPSGEPQRSPTWDLTNVFRGAHDLTVEVLDGSGKTIVRSEPVHVFVQRPSSQFRRKPIAKPPKP
jgi:hypothetical protein